MTRSVRGASLAMMLVVVVLLEGLCAVAATAVLARARLAGDERQSVEGWIVGASALAEGRVTYATEINAIVDGARLAFGWSLRADGWRTQLELVREGSLVRLEVVAERRDAGGGLRAGRRFTLLLSHPPSDTVRVLAHRARI